MLGGGADGTLIRMAPARSLEMRRDRCRHPVPGVEEQPVQRGQISSPTTHQHDEGGGKDAGNRVPDHDGNLLGALTPGYWGCRIGPSFGNTNQNVLPSPNTDSAPIVPPCISTNCLHRASPSPVPCC